MHNNAKLRENRCDRTEIKLNRIVISTRVRRNRDDDKNYGSWLHKRDTPTHSPLEKDRYSVQYQTL